MANKVFISFRFNDGNEYKEFLSLKFRELDYTIDVSENEDRSMMSEDAIKRYLYGKLRNSSITIVILTPNAINYQRNRYGKIDDWLYDELRYSLEDREGNRTNGVIALYTPSAKDLLIKYNPLNHTDEINYFNNLVRKNMLNVKDRYKYNPKPGIYNKLEDNYISLVPFNDFIDHPKKYINNALNKRGRIDHFKITKHID